MIAAIGSLRQENFEFGRAPDANANAFCTSRDISLHRASYRLWSEKGKRDMSSSEAIKLPALALILSCVSLRVQNNSIVSGLVYLSAICLASWSDVSGAYQRSTVCRSLGSRSGMSQSSTFPCTSVWLRHFLYGTLSSPSGHAVPIRSTDAHHDAAMLRRGTRQRMGSSGGDPRSPELLAREHGQDQLGRRQEPLLHR